MSIVVDNTVNVTNSPSESDQRYSQYSAVQAAFERKVDELRTPESDAEAATFLSCEKPTVRIITPAIAASIHRNHNKHNRDFQVSKAKDYSSAMERGEWRLNHQGLAHYDGAELADGQHRCGAIVLSGQSQNFMVSRIDRDAAPTIDLSKGRTAGDALQLAGISDAKIKATVSKSAMEYRCQMEFGSRPRLTVLQVKNWVEQHDDVVSDAVHIGKDSTSNVSEPCLSPTDASTIALLMLLGGFQPNDVVGFISSLQQGVATYAESPTVELSRKYTRSKLATGKGRLGKLEKLALAGKAAGLWKQNLSVSKLVWKPKAEALPTFEPPANDS